MKKITLKKLERSQLEVLQNQLQSFSVRIFYKDAKENFIDAIISLDIINSLYFILRSRIESERTFYNLNLRPSQAAVILKCILNNQSTEPYAVSFFEKIKELIDKQLKELV